ncbi:MAG: hypothetical protein EOO06_08255 [Chitinophagaceae bacterium]|nr:MAG: hypothetical protein EOO06_08255 [Chitinophagaceae bacterium]
MKYLVILLACFSCCSTKGTKQQTDTNVDSTVATTTNGSTPAPTNKPDTVTQPTPVIAVQQGKPVALYFGSMASGPIGDEFLKTWLKQFIKNEKVNITADKYGGCGKEGEYIIVINKSNFSADTETKFMKNLEKLVSDEMRRTKAENSSAGPIEIRKEPAVEDYTYCRLGSSKWL